MPRFVALLRGVNVGKGNRVPMAEFKLLLEELGCTEVKTLLNSGNAVFTSTGRSAEKHAAAIQTAVEARLGVSTPTVVKSAVELTAIVRECPAVPPKSEHSRYVVAFSQHGHQIQALSPLLALAQAPETFHLGANAAYLHCPAGLLASKVAVALLGNHGKGITTRNWATVVKLVEASASGLTLR
jgi:uncharacterized protein (DUF1697 family)